MSGLSLREHKCVGHARQAHLNCQISKVTIQFNISYHYLIENPIRLVPFATGNTHLRSDQSRTIDGRYSSNCIMMGTSSISKSLRPGGTEKTELWYAL